MKQVDRERVNFLDAIEKEKRAVHKQEDLASNLNKEREELEIKFNSFNANGSGLNELDTSSDLSTGEKRPKDIVIFS